LVRIREKKQKGGRSPSALQDFDALSKEEVVDENQSVKASRGKNERTNTVAFRPDPSK
jgi:hypothetical protein